MAEVAPSAPGSVGTKAAKTYLMRLWTVEALAEYVSVAEEVIVKLETAENWCSKLYTGCLYSVRKPPFGFYSFLSSWDFAC
jgi:hypothetical protein